VPKAKKNIAPVIGGTESVLKILEMPKTDFVDSWFSA
jgi:hypothetical protein